jgi:tripartite-type tricarboxylate transporter receptor subunit TctC
MTKNWPALLTIGVFFGTCTSAVAETPADFYRGKQINFIVSSDVGGGFDAYARLIARHISQFIPGRPAIVVQNMPGAGGVRAANFLYSVAPKDGTSIGIVQNTVPVEPLYGNKQALFDSVKFNWLGSPNEETAVLAIWHTVPVQTVKDAKTHELTIGASGGMSSSAFFARVFEEVFDIKIRVIPGYKGASEAMMAMERGENDGNTSAYWSSLKSTKPDWIREKKIKMVFQYGARPHSELRDIPFAMDLVHDPRKRDLLMVASAPLGLGRPILAPPDVPRERVSALRNALSDTFKNSDYLAECSKQRLDCDIPGSGEEISKRVSVVYNASTEVSARIRALYNAGQK